MVKRRTKQKHFEFSEYEAKTLKVLACKTGRKECDIVRELVMGFKPPEAPGDNFYNAINEIRKIGVNINQIAHMANATGMVDSAGFREEAEKLDALIIDIRRIVLEPQKKHDLNEIIKNLEWMLWDNDEDQETCDRIRSELIELMKRCDKGDGDN
ncbi:MAG: plasmid mobilization relaxosome protein MobC [Lachnospiraceae bacterium]|nr:plasmid mobilization relaxosome protein MobC [Lachnospiraceae bacterium]